METGRIKNRLLQNFVLIKELYGSYILRYVYVAEVPKNLEISCLCVTRCKIVDAFFQDFLPFQWKRKQDIYIPWL